jgi:hypothetical protein
MPDTYPVVKIPALIANAKPTQVERIALVTKKLAQPARNPQLVLRGRQVGYGLLFLSTVIFAVAVVRDVKILPYSVISFCLGLATVNMASLFDQPSNLTQQRTLRRTKSIDIIPIDYKLLLDGKVMLPSTVDNDTQKSVFEQHFRKYLTKHFGDISYPSYEFKTDGEYQYSSDFTLQLENQISLIIEIDEPYNEKNNEPQNCTDCDQDDNQDLFFVNGNWIVIRFSEFQGCAYPTECCYKIAQVIDSIDPIQNLSRQFKGVSDLPTDPRWNTRQAIKMAQARYRLGYLKKYGIYAQAS